MTKKKLLVIDGHNFLFRAFAIPFQFYSAKGTPLHVVTAYLNLVRRAIRAIPHFSDHDSLIIVFDSQKQNPNVILSNRYKANRKKDYSQESDSPFMHYPYIINILNDLGICHIESPIGEADDAIASIITSFHEMFPHSQSFIISQDSDFYQLICSETKVIHLRKKGVFDIIDKQSLTKRIGISPQQYVLYKSIVGDSADNIKGISGIGPVRARSIVNKEMDFELENYKELLDLNKKLITLNRTLEIDISFEALPCNIDKIFSSNREIWKDCNF